MAKFEVVSGYKNCGIRLPERKTAASAGYDFEVAEDTLLLPYDELAGKMLIETTTEQYKPIYTLDEVAAMTKKLKTKPTLVPTGVKCKLDPGTYLELSVRSSCPLKHWIILANGVGKFK